CSPPLLTKSTFFLTHSLWESSINCLASRRRGNERVLVALDDAEEMTWRTARADVPAVELWSTKDLVNGSATFSLEGIRTMGATWDRSPHCSDHSAIKDPLPRPYMVGPASPAPLLLGETLGKPSTPFGGFRLVPALSNGLPWHPGGVLGDVAGARALGSRVPELVVVAHSELEGPRYQAV
ncbi:hypothetical protein BDN72DRAFT_865808, partial [Pluteus cervinus]